MTGLEMIRPNGNLVTVIAAYEDACHLTLLHRYTEQFGDLILLKPNVEIEAALRRYCIAKQELHIRDNEKKIHEDGLTETAMPPFSICTDKGRMVTDE